MDPDNNKKRSRYILSFENLITTLQEFWQERGCIVVQPLDMHVGAGTFHHATFLRALGPEPWSCVYVQPSRRPTDGRYGNNPNRLQHYYQLQVLLKPTPENIQEDYLKSLELVGICPSDNDIRFVEDNWESPTLGAWGLGWEVWLNGMEITQFTYFQQIGGFDCNPVSGEITYGLERIAMYLQQKETVYDLIWSENQSKMLTYGDLYLQNEQEMSHFNFEHVDVPSLIDKFTQLESQAGQLIELGLPIPAYESMIDSSHTFNLLDARKAISVTERQSYILRIRKMAQNVAESFLEKRKQLNYPLLDKPSEK